MQYTTLGTTGISVSKICLGSMTWGEQNSEAEGHAQLDLAFDRGVNFIDTAEMYAVPSSPATYGATERVIGNWLNKRGRRDKVVLATKVAGPCGDWMPHIRNAKTRLDRANIEAALDGSLRRLKTDYVDLYQLHWPERKTNYFGQLGYEHHDDSGVPIEETLSVLGDCVRAGRIRTIGVSNETPWGLLEYLSAAKRLNLPRIVAIQNPYNLLNRSFEVGLAEIAIREQIGLLAYSPLGFGTLSGKYLDRGQVDGARLTRFKQFTRYVSERGIAATREYAALARGHGLRPAQMALAYVNSRRFVTSSIIGATTIEQLQENLDSIDLTLDSDVLRDIEKIHKNNPNPSP